MSDDKDIHLPVDDNADRQHDNDHNGNTMQASMSEVAMRITLLGKLIIPPSVNR